MTKKYTPVYFLLIVFFLIPFTEATYCIAEGDADGSGVLDLSDAIALLNHLFLGKEQPVCFKEADVNGDDLVDVSDAVYILQYLFQGGKAPQEIDYAPILGFPPRLAFSLGGDSGVVAPLAYEHFDGDVVSCTAIAQLISDLGKSPGEPVVLFSFTSEEGSFGFVDEPLFVFSQKQTPPGKYRVRVTCEDKGGHKGVTQTELEIGGEVQLLKGQDQSDIVYLQDVPENPPPFSTLPTGCCEVSCGEGKVTCAQTTEVDCKTDTGVNWKGKGYRYHKLDDRELENPNDLCSRAFGVGTAATGAQWKKDHTCDISQSPPSCSTLFCRVKDATILFGSSSNLGSGDSVTLKGYQDKLDHPLGDAYLDEKSWQSGIPGLGPNFGKQRAKTTKVNDDGSSQEEVITEYRAGFSFMNIAFYEGIDEHGNNVEVNDKYFPRKCREYQFVQSSIEIKDNPTPLGQGRNGKYDRYYTWPSVQHDLIEGKKGKSLRYWWEEGFKSKGHLKSLEQIWSQIYASPSSQVGRGMRREVSESAAACGYQKDPLAGSDGESRYCADDGHQDEPDDDYQKNRVWTKIRLDPKTDLPKEYFYKEYHSSPLMMIDHDNPSQVVDSIDFEQIVINGEKQVRNLNFIFMVEDEPINRVVRHKIECLSMGMGYTLEEGGPFPSIKYTPHPYSSANCKCREWSREVESADWTPGKEWSC